MLPINLSGRLRMDPNHAHNLRYSLGTARGPPFRAWQEALAALGEQGISGHPTARGEKTSNVKGNVPFQRQVQAMPELEEKTMNWGEILGTGGDPSAPTMGVHLGPPKGSFGQKSLGLPGNTGKSGG